MLSIVVGIRKGGTGKSMVAVNTSFAFAELGYRVRLVDGDSDEGASQHLDCADDEEPGLAQILAGRATLREVLRYGPSPLAEARGIRHCWPHGFAFIAAGFMLDEIERLTARFLVGDAGENLAGPLLDVLSAPDPGTGEVPEIAVVDTNSSWQNPITRAAFFACRAVLIPAHPAKPSLAGIRRTLEVVEAVQDRPHLAGCEMVRVVINHDDRRTTDFRRYQHEVDRLREDEEIDIPTVPTVIHTRAKLRNSWWGGEPIALHQPNHESAEEFRSLARDLVREFAIPAPKKGR